LQFLLIIGGVWGGDHKIAHKVEQLGVSCVVIHFSLDSPVWTENSQFPGCRQVAAFLAWLDYCDQVSWSLSVMFATC
jgi:hypothetical protein